MTLESLNPASGERIATWPAHTPAEVDAMLSRAHTAYEAWSLTDLGLA